LSQLVRVIGVLFFVFIYVFGIGTMLILYGMMGAGPSSIHFSAKFVSASPWLYFIPVAGVATFCLLFRASAAAHLAPPHTNAQRPQRIAFILAWLLWGAAAVTASLALKQFAYILIWTYISGIILHFTLFGAVSSPSGSSHRTLSETRPNRRFFQFFTFTGAENGIVYSLVFLLLTAAVTSLTLHLLPDTAFANNYANPEREFHRIVSFFCYPAAYFLTTRLLWHAFLHRITNHKFVGLTALFWLILASILPYIFTIGGDDTGLANDFPGNFISLFVSENKYQGFSFHTFISVLWLLIIIAIYTPRIGKTFRAFRPVR